MGRRSYPKPPRKGKEHAVDPVPEPPYDFKKVPNVVVAQDNIPVSISPPFLWPLPSPDKPRTLLLPLSSVHHFLVSICGEGPSEEGGSRA